MPLKQSLSVMVGSLLLPRQLVYLAVLSEWKKRLAEEPDDDASGGAESGGAESGGVESGGAESGAADRARTGGRNGADS